MEDFITQRIGRVLGERWSLRSVLGVGGMAAVYAATDASGAEAAVKVLHPEIGMRPEIRDRFMREGYIANRIEHPGAVRVLEHGTIDEWSVFLVMERLSGESLGDRLTRHGTLPAAELLDVLDQVLDVLAVAHDAGIVHRDLKPDNLFVTTNGTVKVLDFGLARVLDGAPNDLRTRTGIALGTLPYMAPEQALGKRSEIDGRVDIFAMGATAFRILSNRRIHEADSDAGMLLAMASQAAPPLRSVAPGVSEEVAAIIDMALAFNRDARYPDARTMQADVRAVRRGNAPSFAIERRRSREQATRPGTHVMAGPSAAGAAVFQANPGQPQVSQLQTVLGAPPGQAPTVVIGQRAPEPPTVVAPPRVSPSPTVVAVPARAATVAVAPTAHAAPARSRVPIVLLTSLLLLGAAAWLLWPETEADAPAPGAIDADEARPAIETASTEARAQDRGAARELEKKQRETARERRKKMEEFVRERAKKEAEQRREKGKR